MLAKLNTFALQGIDAVPVVGEVDVSVGLPKTVLVGLPEAAVRESVHRIERALVNLGYRRHPGRTVINLAPARFRRESPVPHAQASRLNCYIAGREARIVCTSAPWAAARCGGPLHFLPAIAS
jgi:magnesium chelatase family protein